ncbi:response regulator [Pedobacter cryoconitis]|uniref:histidine kinase n=1 Tax=Pedobacter cryoconitis TaxID=188932 RepID=A0A7X0MHB1_9SPHI|nr:response regulator [Pedobacter cryoconitis]MBB6498949.1 signal transduction histidine kinase/DNA-binding response OmpR family regulator/streptogramin lyase [Pedobacter cryoconitis]
MALDQHGRLWLGNDDGLYCFINHQLKQVYVSKNRIVNLSVKNEVLWIASDGDGILTKKTTDFNPPEEFVLPANPENTGKFISSIFQDTDSRIWIGTLLHGAILVESPATEIWSYKHWTGADKGLLNKAILSLSEDKDHTLWIGSNGYGLCNFNPKNGHFRNYSTKTSPTLSSDFITSILTAADGAIWLSTWGGGVLRYNRAQNTFEHYRCINPQTRKEDKNTWKLFQDKQNKNIWLGTCLNGAVYIFNPNKNRFEIFDPKLINIISFFEDEYGQLWAGTYNALIKVDQKHKKHQYFPTEFAVRNIKSDGHKKLWIATEGGGLQLFDPNNNTFTSYTETAGLASNTTFEIIEDKQANLWISTLGGISIFNPQNKRFKTLNAERGLLSNELSYNAALKLSSGQMAFGSVMGLNLINPDNFKNYNKHRDIYLTNISINNLPIASQLQYVTQKTTAKITAIKIPYDKATVLLSFVSPKYSNHASWSYAYYLQGWDKTWSTTGKNRSTVYNRLTEGTYYFKVKLSEQGNIANNTETLLTIIVLPPFYRSWWAYTFYVICTAALIYAIIRYRSNQIRQAYEVGFAKLQLIKEKELNEKKLNFFTNISHEFRTPLTLIINPLKDLLENSDHFDAKTELNTMLRNSKRLINLTDQLLGFRKLENQILKVYPINFHEMCEEIFKCFDVMARSKNITYRFISPDQDLILYVDYQKIEICIFNLLSNAFKYTPINGDITLKLVNTTDEVSVMIIDNGPGISNKNDNPEKIFEKYYQAEDKFAGEGFGIGLHLVKEFISAHHGSVFYQRDSEQHTVFTLTLKKGSAHYSSIELVSTPPTRQILSLDDINHEDPEEQLIDQADLTSASFITDKKIILVVDDDQEIRKYLKRLLQNQYTIKEAEDGEIGLQMINDFMPDLVIADIVMKNMNGVDFCRNVKHNHKLEHIPVILLTATTSADYKLIGIECGADDYITKPFENKFLIARIDNILKNKSKVQKYFLDTITLHKNSDKVPADFSSFLDKCIEYVEMHINDRELSISALAQETGLSHSGLYRKIKSISGLSINAFIRYIRLRKAALILLTTEANINEVAFQVGINDIKHFRTQFKKVFGLNPSSYVKKHKNSLNPNLKSVINRYH